MEITNPISSMVRLYQLAPGENIKLIHVPYLLYLLPANNNIMITMTKIKKY